MSFSCRRSLVPLLVLSAAVVCAPSGEGPLPSRPNVLWIVWDTVRADRLTPYGFPKETTPFVEEWAAGARVFDNCISTANYTLPSHASMFTGLLPYEHGANNDYAFLDDDFTTIAELFHGAGYETYLFSANPHISEEENFAQGFETAEHPWDEKHREKAIEAVLAKVPPYDRSSALPDKLKAGRYGRWNIKASGQIIRDAVMEWAENGRDRGKPYFAFLNYMEAHQPYTPPEEYRKRMMSEKDVRVSYEINRYWAAFWRYTFGLRDYNPKQIEITAATYDATVAELDDLFKDLITSLEAGGHLRNTIVVLTSDHGEHLGEHHMFDHQYSLYEPLLRVPLIVHYPEKVPAGRDSRPVVNYDLFPTLLHLAGIEMPEDLNTHAVDLLAPEETRTRFAECPGVFEGPFEIVQRVHPTWDPTPWRRELRAWMEGEHKYVWASDGRHGLYDLVADPEEQENLVSENPDLAEEMDQELQEFLSTLSEAAPKDRPPPEMSDEHRDLLRSLGYIDSYGSSDSGGGR